MVERVVGPGELRAPDDSLREQLKRLQITREIFIKWYTSTVCNFAGWYGFVKHVFQVHDSAHFTSSDIKEVRSSTAITTDLSSLSIAPQPSISSNIQTARGSSTHIND